jgi:hypothetical protein
MTLDTDSLQISPNEQIPGTHSQTTKKIRQPWR